MVGTTRHEVPVELNTICGGFPMNSATMESLILAGGVAEV